MELIKTAALRHNAMLERIAKNLSVRLADLGVHLSVRDDEGEIIGLSEPRCEFCQAICNADNSCSIASETAAANILDKKAPEFTGSRIGCSIVALPVKRRRRVIGSITACMPVAVMLDE